jgi:hypothetical protein
VTVSYSATTGYDLVGADGGVFAFGEGYYGQPGTAAFQGSLPALGVHPNLPVVGIVPTVDFGGYFLAARDGGVFSFGDAPYDGSLPEVLTLPPNDIAGGAGEG